MSQAKVTTFRTDSYMKVNEMRNIGIWSSGGREGEIMQSLTVTRAASLRVSSPFDPRGARWWLGVECTQFGERSRIEDVDDRREGSLVPDTREQGAMLRGLRLWESRAEEDER